MILIEITNVNEIVRRERGFIAAKIGPYLTDVKGEVEREVIEELKSAFAERGIEVNMMSTRDVNLAMPETILPPMLPK